MEHRFPQPATFLWGQRFVWTIAFLSSAMASVDSSAQSRTTAEVTDDAELDRKIAAIRDTPNWRFLTKEFLAEVENRQQELHGAPVTTLGRIVDDKKKAIKNALVLLRLPSNTSWYAPFEVFAATWTDDTGIFKFRDQKMPWFEPMHQCTWELMVFAPGFAIDVREFNFLTLTAQIERIYLQPECFVEGNVTNQSDTAQKEVKFAIAEISDPYTYGKMDCSFLRSELLVPLQPDANGKIRFGGLPPQKVVTVISDPSIVVTRVATSDDLDVKRLVPKDKPRSSMIHPYTVKTFEFKIEADKLAKANKSEQMRQLRYRSSMQGPRLVDIQVVDAVTGEGVDNVAVGYGFNVDEVRINPGSVATDKTGRARLNVPDSEVDVFIGGRRWGYETEFNEKHGLDDNIPNLRKADWLRSLPAGRDKTELVFKVRPVKPLKILVTKADGTPVASELRIMHEGSYYFPFPTTGVDGRCEVPLRPVIFEAEISATAQDGLKGNVTVQLSRDLSEQDSIQVIVE